MAIYAGGKGFGNSAGFEKKKIGDEGYAIFVGPTPEKAEEVAYIDASGNVKIKGSASSPFVIHPEKLRDGGHPTVDQLDAVGLTQKVLEQLVRNGGYVQYGNNAYSAQVVPVEICEVYDDSGVGKFSETEYKLVIPLRSANHSVGSYYTLKYSITEEKYTFSVQEVPLVYHVPISPMDRSYVEVPWYVTHAVAINDDGVVHPRISITPDEARVLATQAVNAVPEGVSVDCLSAVFSANAEYNPDGTRYDFTVYYIVLGDDSKYYMIWFT